MFWLLYLALPVYAGAQVASHVASKCMVKLTNNEKTPWAY